LWRKFDSLLQPSRQTTTPFTADDIASYFSSKIDAIRLTTATVPPPVITARAVQPLLDFDPVTDDKVAKLLKTVADKQYALDLVPTWLVKQCADILVPVITSMVNLSLSSATFPHSQKLARVLPLLKKPDMDVFDLKSYRPVSNLTFISKFLERLVARRLLIHSELNQLLPRYQSAYRPHHSTETALTRVTNDILCSIDKGNVCALVLLDLSAAFDTVDHGLLMSITSSRFGLSGRVQQWLQSYLSGRTQTVSINNQQSTPSTLPCGVPQGSVLGPAQFVMYTEDLGELITDFSVLPLFFADDSQLLASTTPSGVADVCRRLERCVSAVHDWCTRRRLQLNPSKTEAIWFGSNANLDRLAVTDVTICLDQATIHPSDCVRNLGVLLDSSLSMRQHIAKIASTCFFHLRRLRKLRRVLDLESRKRLVCAFILTRIDYCNAVLANLPDSALAPLQRVLHAAARFVAAIGPRDHITPTLISLHWLPVRQRITYKLCTMMHSVYYGEAPSYISDIVTPVTHLPGRAHLRSAKNGDYNCPRVLSGFGRRSFSVSGPDAWNSLPRQLRGIAVASTFKRHLKSELFLQAYGVSTTASTVAEP